jgi:predicted transcriptional regulator
MSLMRVRIVYMFEYMKALIVEFDDETAARLDRVAPGRTRQRSEFIRNAVRKALWEIEELVTAEAYRRQPDSEADAYLNADVWEPGRKRRRTRKRR